MNGILLSRASSYYRYNNNLSPLPAQKVVINLKNTIESKVDLSRTMFLEKQENWVRSVQKAHIRHLFDMSMEGLLRLEPLERLYQMARISLYHNIEPQEMWEIFPHTKWPIAFVEDGGHINVLEFADVSKCEINLYPEILEMETSWLYHRRNQNNYVRPLIQWVGGRLLIYEPYRPGINDSVNSSAFELLKYPIKKLYRFKRIRFLQPPWEGYPPLIQRVLCPIDIREKTPEVIEILKKAVKDPYSMNSIERNVLLETLNPHSHIRYQRSLNHLPEFVEFPLPFNHSFGYGWRLLNLNHPIVKNLIRFRAALELSKMQRNLPNDLIGRLEDAFNLIPEFWGVFIDVEELSKVLTLIMSLADDLNLFDIRIAGDLIITTEDFVPGSLEPLSRKLPENDIRPFGMPL